jgi:AhpC/TSA family
MTNLIDMLRTAFGRLVRGRRGRRPLLAQGERFPAVELVDDQGRKVSSADWIGRRTILWFYPKADTPG